MTRLIQQVAITFPATPEIEYRLTWSSGGQSEWRAVHGNVPVPPAACAVEWRAKPAKESAEEKFTQARSRANVCDAKGNSGRAA